MLQKKLSQGVVNSVPNDLATTLNSLVEAREAWNNITPLARNEWLCWIESAKLIDTRKRRIQRTQKELIQGKRRPCCWAGCTHRDKK